MPRQRPHRQPGDPPLRVDPEGIPRFRYLAGLLREEIVDGKRWQPGDRYLSEADLTEFSGYSRETCRSAVRVLREERLIESVKGVGYFIRPKSEWRLKS